MDIEIYDTDENNFDSDLNFSNNDLYGINPLRHTAEHDLGDHVEESYTFGSQTRHPKSDTFGMQADRGNKNRELSCLQCVGAAETFCHVRVDSLAKLKDSTRKLLCLLEEIQAKTYTNSLLPDKSYQLTESIKAVPTSNNVDCTSVTNIIGAGALKKLEIQTKHLDTIHIEVEDDDCSVYKRLTRKCNCLNQSEYNDFIIHFNEDTKYFTSTVGEIIKNLRIIKKFLYMGGEYTKHALMFMNEGMSESTHTERVEITQGCAHSDICNVFEDQSIVTMCISCPCKYENYGDAITQGLAASYLFKLAQLEEGRRYLKFTSKITNDLKKLIRKKANKLEFDTLESLNATLNLMHPPMANADIVHYSKPLDEGFGSKTITALLQYRKYMTMDEIFTHLDLLHNLSNSDNGKQELTTLLRQLLHLFRQLLMECDNSEMNIIITNILNNILSRNMIKQPELPKTVVMADTATEPIKMKIGMSQIPTKKNTKKLNKSKQVLGNAPKFRQSSIKKIAEWESTSFLRSKKFFKEQRNTVIIVPIEEET